MAGQTKSQIRGLLAAAGLTPRQRHGQNFLVDLNLMRKVVAAAELQPADVVLEVGCGTGSLTELLLEAGVRVVGVEIDRGLQGILRERLGEEPRFTLVQGDALASKHRINPALMQLLTQRPPEPPGHYKLVANLPYQIATPLLMELLYATPRCERLTATIQREVGERLAAKPGGATYGPISVITQTLAAIELVAILPPTAFWPQPQVESVLVAIFPRPSTEVPLSDVAGFGRFVQNGFGQRRKMLRRILAHLRPLEARAVFDRAGVSAISRPETLAPTQWQALFRAVRSVPSR